MGKTNEHGGKGHRKDKKTSSVSREVLYKTENQDYATILTMLGDKRCNVMTHSDKMEKIGIIRGSMRNRCSSRVNKGNIVLITIRDYENGKVDIIHVYSHDEMKYLKNMNEIEIHEEEDDDNIIFGYGLKICDV